MFLLALESSRGKERKMVKKIIGLLTALMAVILLVACSSEQKFESMPKTLEGTGKYWTISKFPDPKGNLNIDKLKKEGVNQETKEYLIKYIGKVQPLIIDTSEKFSDDAERLDQYYGYQRLLYIISDKYLEGTKEGEEYKKTALSEMIKLKEQYEKLTGQKVTNSGN